VIGIDASAAGMAHSSLRGARPARKGGLPNALFVVAAAEALPAELAGVASDLTIAFPWGSLLRGALAIDDGAAASSGIVTLLAPGAAARILLSVDDRDRLAIPQLHAKTAGRLADRWRRRGAEVVTWRRATDPEIAGADSSWARRLRAGRDREVWLLDLRRPGVAEPRATGG
jgi:16S rRNA (adenine(1408)-N(1))-methyltransferase